MKKCSKCGNEKPLSEFTKKKRCKDGHSCRCKECDSKAYKEYYQKNKNTLKKKSQKRYKTHKDKMNRQSALAHRKRRQEDRLKVIEHYSNGTNKCADPNCEWNDIRALTVDHINGEGAKHRKRLGQEHICKWLIENNFPEGFQILCMNHQFVKRHENNEVPRKYTI